ncbi:LysE family translocator [Methanonatronarchaeum sp. AMET6-2]|uniref:LysE family translocator n=1 Tax=Methanonatronarchaeum sp. AMET6-2 TaxID=2933293 RepID=UPI00121B55C5|nr:LysE family translocator [Methanonatronarchaeum sp. AMET6-2]RZN63144.1 MAG: LysE family translocator [Methanonatronarchaeia archaeon]UOY09438.1 LysE family translocator [Methanonatronarchaeum sp. AMET6-2]
MIEPAISLFGGMILGLSLAAPPGPINAVIAEETVFKGWISGFKAGLGALSADILFLFLALIGATTIIYNSSLLRAIIMALGGMIMIYIGLHTYRETKNPTKITDKKGRGIYKTFTLSLTNPYQIIWWLTVGITILQTGTINVVGLNFQTGSILLLAGFFLGILIWITSFPAIMKFGADRSQTFTTTVGYLSAGILIIFGITFLYGSTELII